MKFTPEKANPHISFLLKLQPLQFCHSSQLFVVCTCITCMFSSCCSLCVCVNMYHCMCLPVTSPLSVSPSLHHFLSVWVSMQSDPGELITVGARVAGTKTLHRQHNSGSRNQTGSTQSSPTGPAQISSAQQSHTHRTTNPRPAFRSAGLKPAFIIITNSNMWYFIEQVLL